MVKNHQKPMYKEYKLRPTQQKLVLELVDRLKHNDDTALIAGTGIGKTIMAANLIAYYAQVFNPKIDATFTPSAWVTTLGMNQIVFIVHLDNLVEQTAIKFRDVFLSRYHHGGKKREHNMDKAITFIKNGLPYDATKPIVIASLQSLSSRYEQYIDSGWLNPSMLIFDECHTTAFCDTGRKLINEVKYKKRLGLTATPFRLEKDISFSDVWGNVAVAPCFGELISMGELCPIDYKMFESAEELKNLKKSKNDFNQKQAVIKFNTPDRIKFAIDKWEKLASTEKTIVFSIDVSHGEAIKQEFITRGYKAEIISYKLDRKDRSPIYSSFTSGDTQILISVKALAVGFDEPSVTCGIDLQPTTSISAHWQKIGRIARLFPGKTRGLWLDFVGNIENLGLFGIPDHVKMTEEMILSKKDFLKREGDAPIKICSECNTINHASVKNCKECGYEFPAKDLISGVPEGDLVSIVTQSMVDSQDYAIKFYRTLRHKLYIKNRHPNHAYADYLAIESISSRFPIPHPRDREEHKVWSVGAICNPSSFEEGIEFLNRITKIVRKTHKNKKDYQRIIIDSAIYLEFNDDVYDRLKDEIDNYDARQREFVENLLVG